MTDTATGAEWQASEPTAAGALPGEAAALGDGVFEARWLDESPVRPRRLVATVDCRLGGLEVRRAFELVPGCPAIRCTWYVRGRPAADSWRATAAAEGQLRNIESLDHARDAGPLAPVLDRLTFAPRHLQVQAVQFFDITDRRNNLVSAREVAPYKSPTRLRGNLLLVRDALRDAGLFVLKEAPCSDVQLADPGFDFAVQRTGVEAVGLGIDPHDVGDAWVRCYGVVVGVGSSNEQDLLAALRSYQGTQRRLLADRDEMIVLNTWGDRSQDAAMGEAFALREIDGAARLGVTHVQLDDGWQKGRSANSAHAGGFLSSIWNRDPQYWTVDRHKFPNGLEPVIEHAKAKGVELCLWYNPSRDDGYGHWEKDADQLLQLHRRYGVRVFKIDGVDIPNKRSETNLRRMFDKVQEGSGGAVVFNLDVTAMRRFGYHYFAEYGNLFLENRYTDWGNYYPHWTLRNLWQLAKYVPPQRLQIEFLNVWRNADKYAADDPLAPRNVPIEYCFAVTMMAQPLAWLECRNLPDEAYARWAPLIDVYREHMQAIHAGRIVPIGEEPSGVGFPGFVSIGEGSGYMLTFREFANRDGSVYPLPLDERPRRWTKLAGDGEIAETAATSSVSVRYPQPFGFGLFRYEDA